MRRRLLFWCCGALLACAAPRTPAPELRASPAPASASAATAPSAKPPAVAAEKPAPPPPLELAEARHVLNRLTFGPRTADVAKLREMGIDAWLAAELAPERTPDPELERALEPYREALSTPAELVENWLGAEAMEGEGGRKLMRDLKPHFKAHLAKVALAELTRHVVSERQLEEVMVDFWANHFNVFAKKGSVQLLAGDYVERALRPHALGRFGELLLATARHPAMLIYLDNQKNRSRGLNENYARELLELHTVGVDSGYGQSDVIDVARVLTGWTLREPPQGSFGFVFDKKRHDNGEKTVLGVRFPARGGEAEGVRLLEALAAHPATARHLGRKLCQRFVADEPPAGCVDVAARAYLESGGETRAVIRAIVAHESFLAPAAYGAKLKKPLEFAASALRAVGAVPDGTTQLGDALAALGEPLLLESVPTGYSDSEADWATSGGMLGRLTFASMLAFRKLKGVTFDAERALPGASTAELLEAGNLRFLGGSASE
ncbi:MAG TPA: DUF1800 domain-containing protein, partial [Polyangiaceae bacterium]|nr:DUF1800 domain-containing protein [Polyangiaceae bacterium]